MSEEEIFETKHYARELKYPKAALVFNGTDEDDFLYCLPHNKELSVCREMYIVQHASGKRLSEEEIFETKHYARELKYPKAALVFNGTDEDDFLYCLPHNKELSVCREMARSMGFPKLEAGLCAMTKDDLADSLAYNSLKVQKLCIWKFMNF